MTHVLCKVYAAFSPADQVDLKALEAAATGALGSGEPWLFLEGDLLRISFEGMYFPLEETLERLAVLLPCDAKGRLDYLDLENWTLTRYEFANGTITASTRGLNQVMEYSGL